MAIILTWFIPSGGFNSAGFESSGVLRFGLNDLEWLVYDAIYIGLDKIVFLLFLGVMYGVLSHINAYQKLVKNIAKKFSKHKELTVVICSVLIALLTSFWASEFAVLIFVPFIIQILNEMKLDKMSILLTTFGSMLVGVLGATLGTDGLVQFSKSFVSSEQSLRDVLFDTILIRTGILVIGLVLFNFFALEHIKKTKDNESATMFPLEETDDNKKSSVIPLIIMGVLLFIIVFITFTDWQTDFNISIFNEFRDLVNNVKIGDNFYIFNSILGTYTSTLDVWNLYAIPPVMFLFTVVVALCYRVKFNDFISSAINGIKKVIKPILVVMGCFALIVVVYMSPFVPTIVNKILSLTQGFNLATMLLASLVTNIFHPDIVYTAEALSAYLSVEYIDYVKPVMLIFTTMHSLIQFLVPTSIFLGIGLTTLKVNYKDWLKYIWKYVLGMFICLLVVIILITVI